MNPDASDLAALGPVRPLRANAISVKDLTTLSERELADLQASHKQPTAEWKLCEQEFIRRQGMQQLGAPGLRSGFPSAQ